MKVKLTILLARLLHLVRDFRFYLLVYLVLAIISLILFYLFLKVWKRKSPLKLISFNLFLLLLLLAHLFYGFEIYYRYIFDATDNVYQLKTSQRWVDRHVQWNSDGFRDEHFFVEKDPRETRLIFLGDSYTFGHGIANKENRYSELLGNMLRAGCDSDKTLKTYNMALPGIQSKAHLNTIQNQALRHHPDAIVMEYYFDDIDGDKLEGQEAGFHQKIFAYKQKPLLNFFLSRSYALEYFYIRALFYLLPQIDWGSYINYNETLYQNPQVWQRHLNTLQQIINTTRKNKVKLVVFFIPLTHRLGPDYPLVDVHQKLTDFFAQNNVPTIDMLPIFNQYDPQKLMVSRQDFHLNETGQLIIATALYQTLKDMTEFQCH